MATTPTGLRVPAGTDVFDPDGDLRDLGASLEGRIIVPVANATERQAVASLVTPTASEPLYVHRADAHPARRLEATSNGSDWIPVGAQHAWTGFIATPTAVVNTGAIPGSGFNAEYVGGPLSYATRIHLQIAASAGFDGAAVDVALEVVAASAAFVAPAQMVPQPVRAAPGAWAAISHMATIDLPAGAGWDGFCIARTSGPSAYYRLGIHALRVPA